MLLNQSCSKGNIPWNKILLGKTFTSDQDGVTVFRFTFLPKTAKTGQSIWNYVQHTGYQTMKNSESWELGNKCGKPYKTL